MAGIHQRPNPRTQPIRTGEPGRIGDSLNWFRIGDEGNQAQLGAALWAQQGEGDEQPREQDRPLVPAVRAPGADAAGVVTGAGASVVVASCPSAVTAARSGEWDASTPMIAVAMPARRRDQGGEPIEQFQGGEGQRGPAVGLGFR